MPQEDLRRFGADPHARTVTPEWRAVMAFEIERNRGLYRESDAGLALLPPASRRCVATARVLYARILERLEAADYDVLTARATCSTVAKAALAARIGALARPRLRLVPPWTGRPPRPAPSGWVADDPVVLVDEAGAPTGTAPKSAVHHDDTPRDPAFAPLRR